MATSSITKDFVVSGERQVEMFVDALESSYRESLERKENSIKITLKSKSESKKIKKMLKRWKKMHG